MATVALRPAAPLTKLASPHGEAISLLIKLVSQFKRSQVFINK
jgi:hypothetical protein